MTLTKRQKEVLDFLVSFVNKHGYSPSFEEIAPRAAADLAGHRAQAHHHARTQRIRPARLQPEPLDRGYATAQAGARAGARAPQSWSCRWPGASPRAVRSRPSRSRETFSLGEFARADSSFVLAGEGQFDDRRPHSGRRLSSWSSRRRSRIRAKSSWRLSAATKPR